MADYAFRTLEQRQKIETLWAANTAPKKIAEEMGVSETVIYTELRRGRDPTERRAPAVQRGGGPMESGPVP